MTLSGCGTYVPDHQEFWGSSEDNDLRVNLITAQVACELGRAVQQLYYNAEHVPVEYVGGPNAGQKPPSISWFDKWGVQITLTMAISESSSLNPGLSLNTFYENDVKKFSTGPVTTSQNFSLGLGGLLSSSATRTDKLNMFYTVQQLKLGSDRLRSCLPSNQANASLFIQSDLKLYEWMRAALGVPTALVADFGIDKTDKNAISHEIKFQIISNGNINPQWKLVQVSANTGNSPLFSVGRDRAQTLLITFGPALGKELAPSAQNLHIAGQFGEAVSQNR